MREESEELFVGLYGILVRSSIGALGVGKLVEFGEFGESGCTLLYIDPHLK